MNKDIVSQTVAALQSQRPPDFELLEEMYSRPYDGRHCPLLSRERYCDPLWDEKIVKHSKLTMLFRWMICPWTGRNPSTCPDSELPALRLLLKDVLSSQSEIPVLKEKAKQLSQYLERLVS